MTAANESAAVAQDYADKAVSATKGASPVRIFKAGKVGADACVAFTDGNDTVTVGQVLGVWYVLVNGVQVWQASSTGVSVTGMLGLSSIEDGLTAAAGGTQAGALALSATKLVHRVSTVGTAADSVKLPLATGSGNIHFVMNSAAANSMQVFGSGTDTINDVATATGVAQAAGKGAWYVDIAAGKWYRSLGA